MNAVERKQMNKQRIVLYVILTFFFVGVASFLIPVRIGGGLSQRGRTEAALRNVAASCTAYQAYFGEWPSSLFELERNRSNVVFIAWGKAGSIDGWGRPIQFHPFNPSVGHGSAVSFGRDGRLGGAGLDADIEITFGEKR